MAKSACLTYALWAVGGMLGLHHLYLGRSRHALVWILTLGGCCGLGWVRDLVCLSDYVKEANGDRSALAELQHRMKMDSSPPFHTLRFIGELIVGMLLGFVVRSALPEGIIETHRYLELFVPIFVAIGVWLVGCISHERVSLKVAILSAYGGLILSANDLGNPTYMALLSTIVVNMKGKSWDFRKRKRHVCIRLTVVAGCALIYTALWCSAIYHNGSITTAEGEKIKMSEAFRHFYNSPAWEETKSTLKQLWNELMVNGPFAFFNEFVMALDPQGEAHAQRVLDLSSGATEKEVSAAYRKLVRLWHPDKHPDPKAKKLASAKFMEIQQAYETLSSIKIQRAQRNTRHRSRTDEL